MLASGEVSVMPQACTTCTPCRSRAFARLSGTADPPHAMCRRWLMSWGCASRWLTMPIHTAGTAAEMVGFSSASKRAIGSGCR